MSPLVTQSSATGRFSLFQTSSLRRIPVVPMISKSWLDEVSNATLTCATRPPGNSIWVCVPSSTSMPLRALANTLSGSAPKTQRAWWML